MTCHSRRSRSGGLAGGLVAGIGVDRVAVDGDLLDPAGPGDGAERARRILPRRAGSQLAEPALDEGPLRPRQRQPQRRPVRAPGPAARPTRRSSSARAMWNCGQFASLGSSGSRMASPATGPSAMATVTARLASTTAVGSYLASSPYSAATWRQSVSVAREWQAAMAACSWYGPGLAARAAGASSARPSRILSRSHLLRSWSGSGTTSPAVSSRAARRASVSSRASSPAASGCCGSNRTSARASRSARSGGWPEPRWPATPRPRPRAGTRPARHPRRPPGRRTSWSLRPRRPTSCRGAGPRCPRSAVLPTIREPAARAAPPPARRARPAGAPPTSARRPGRRTPPA